MVTSKLFCIDGILDPTFGDNGLATVFISPNGAFGRRIAVDAQGNIVQIGLSDPGALQGAIVKYLADGALDTSFNNTGIRLQTSGTATQFTDVLIQPDNKIVATGFTTIGVNQVIVARYNPDGSNDTSFATVGLFIQPIGSNAFGSALARQQDDKLIVFANGGAPANQDIVLIRLNIDGSPDVTFGTNGFMVDSFGSTQQVVDGLLQQDGKIVATGLTDVAGNKIFIARYNTNGSRDTSFGTNGVTVSLPPGQDSAFALGMAQQADGKFLAVGQTILGGNSNILLARYNTDGSLDTTFGINGFVITERGGTDSAVDVAFTLNNKIIITGGSDGNTIYVARYNQNGSLDTSFGPNQDGFFTLSGASTLGGRGLFILPNQDILVGGDIVLDTAREFLVFRLLNQLTTGDELTQAIIKKYGLFCELI